MTAKARFFLVCMAVTILLAAEIGQAQKDTGVPAGGRTVTGRVLDDQGRPMPGVEIWGAMGHLAAVSGPDGRFTVANLQAREQLTACPAGWLPAEHRPSSSHSGEPVEIRLQPAARLAGRVVDAQGEPVPGIGVTAQFAGWTTGCVILMPSQRCLGHPQYRLGRTDADGRFVFEAVQPGWFQIIASVGTDIQVVRGQAVTGNHGHEVEVALPRKLVSLEGRVVDAEGKAVSGAQVSTAAALPASQTQTDEAGLYRFSHVFSGSSQLEVSHPDFGWIQKEIRIGESPARFDVRMPAATVVEGRILARDGSPIAEPWLTVDWRGVPIGPEGRFRFHVTPGEHVVRVHALGWITAERPVTAKGVPIELSIEVSRPATVSGRITGLPPGAHGAVEIEEERHGRMGAEEDDRFRFDGRTSAGEDGRFRLHNVAPGTWTLVASDSHGRTLKRRIQVEEGREVTVEDLQFLPLPTVRGRVLLPGGQAVPSAHLTFEQGERRAWARTDAEGRFSAQLVDGTWTVKAEMEGLGPAATTVAMAGDPVEIPDLRLAWPVALSGYVRGLAPGEIPFVQATSEDGLWKRGSHAAQDLSFQILELWPGTWNLTAFLGERKATTRVRVMPGDTAVRADVSFGED